jgi:hypothetical protein
LLITAYGASSSLIVPMTAFGSLQFIDVNDGNWRF